MAHLGNQAQEWQAQEKQASQDVNLSLCYIVLNALQIEQKIKLYMASSTQWTWVQTLGDSEGEGGQVCCSPWGRKELDMT